MKQIKQAVLLSTFGIAITLAFAFTPKHKDPCTQIRECNTSNYVPLPATFVCIPDGLPLNCEVDASGQPCENQTQGCLSTGK